MKSISAINLAITENTAQWTTIKACAPVIDIEVGMSYTVYTLRSLQTFRFQLFERLATIPSVRSELNSPIETKNYSTCMSMKLMKNGHALVQTS